MPRYETTNAPGYNEIPSSLDGSRKSNNSLYSNTTSFRSITHPNFMRRIKAKGLQLTRDDFDSIRASGWEEIGNGQFGTVYKTPVHRKDCAVKMLKDRHGRTEFQNEALMLAEAKGNTSHVIEIIGLYLPEKRADREGGEFEGFNRTMIVTEYMPNGDVFNFLRFEYAIVTHSRILHWCISLAGAAVFMKKHGIVHRDISARNCFLNVDMNLKLGDFGLARKSENGSAVYSAISQARKLPIPWLSVEAFQNTLFTSASDIWAIGITFWEFYTRCEKTPYENEIPLAVLGERLLAGKRLKRPKHMPKTVYKICERTWAQKTDRRPDAEQLQIECQEMLERPEQFGIKPDNLVGQAPKSSWRASYAAGTLRVDTTAPSLPSNSGAPNDYELQPIEENDNNAGKEVDAFLPGDNKEDRRPSKSYLIIILAVVFCLLIAGGAVGYFTMRSSPAEIRPSDDPANASFSTNSTGDIVLVEPTSKSKKTTVFLESGNSSVIEPTKAQPKSEQTKPTQPLIASTTVATVKINSSTISFSVNENDKDSGVKKVPKAESAKSNAGDDSTA